MSSTHCCPWTRWRQRPQQQVRAGLHPLIAGYGEWLDTQETAAAQLPAHLRDTADLALLEARRAHKRLQDGLDHVVADAEALRCFQFMNAVMRDQRIASQVAALRASDPTVSIDRRPHHGRPSRREGRILAPIPAGVHLDAARCANGPGGTPSQRRAPGAGGIVVLPHRWWQDRGIPRAGRLHVRDPPPPGLSSSLPTARWTAGTASRY